MSALESQVGGDHYKSMTIQPVKYILANNIGYIEGSVIKYVSRWRKKGGVEDLKKAIHFLQILIEDGETELAESDSENDSENDPVWLNEPYLLTPDYDYSYDLAGLPRQIDQLTAELAAGRRDAFTRVKCLDASARLNRVARWMETQKPGASAPASSPGAGQSRAEPSPTHD